MKKPNESKRYLHLVLIGLLIIGLSLACTLSGGESSTEENAENKIATSVAETMAAQGPEVPLPAGDTPNAPPSTAIPPTISPTSEPDILFQGISFSYDDSLAASIAPEIIPAEVSESGPWGNLPEYVQFNFLGYPLSDTFHDPRIMVFSADAYRAVNPNTGNAITSLQELLAAKPSNPESLPFLPGWNAAQFMQAQVAYFDFQNGSGVRYLTIYGQAARVVNNYELFYTYQGLTNDGRYYISAVLPISHPSLPAKCPDVLDPSFYETFETHLIEIENQLNGEAGDSFAPTLSLLDTMMQSFTVDGP